MERRKKSTPVTVVTCFECGTSIDLDPWAMHPHNGGFAIRCGGCGVDRPVRRNDRYRHDLLQLFGERRRVQAAQQATARANRGLGVLAAMARTNKAAKTERDATSRRVAWF